MNTDKALETVAGALARGEITQRAVMDYLRGQAGRTAKGTAITIRITPEDKAELQRKAAGQGMTLTDFILSRCKR